MLEGAGGRGCWKLWVLLISHGGQIPAANAAARRRAAATGGCVCVATAARGRVPLAEGAAGFVAANQEIGGGAALHTGEIERPRLQTRYGADKKFFVCFF